MPKKDSKEAAPRKKLYPVLDEDLSEALGQVASLLDLVSEGMTNPEAKRAMRLAEMFITLAGLAESGDDVGFMVRKVWLLMHRSRTANEGAARVVSEFQYAAESEFNPKEAARCALESLARMLPDPEWEARVNSQPVLLASARLVRELRTRDTKAQKMASEQLWKLLGLPGNWENARHDLRRKRE